jgi:hypothetical protein
VVIRVLGIVSIILMALGTSWSERRAGRDSCSLVVVSRDELREAMAVESRLGYDATATTNVGRYFAGVVLRLARKAQSDDPEGMPLFIGHDDWFIAFLTVHDLEETTAPLYLALAHKHRQDVVVDYNRNDVVKDILSGGEPDVALNIKLSWPESDDAPDQYSFIDTLSNPTLRVTNKRVLRYRLLDFGDMIVFDEVEGITGRPESGILGAVFKLIGEGHVAWSRSTVSDDGILVIRARAKKSFIKVTTTVSIEPDGVAQKGLPVSRPDLQPLEDRLMEDLDIRYHDWQLTDELADGCPAVK